MDIVVSILIAAALVALLLKHISESKKQVRDDDDYPDVDEEAPSRDRNDIR